MRIVKILPHRTSKILRNFSIAVFVLLYFGISFSQDPTFTQFYSNPLYLNPALTGATGCSRFSFNYRNEWPQLT
ncbi:MAG: type IX secretion system membrane protein PorP/SprF, partial [Flavobacteriia bacterium]|nr:type IX secretion system membrane protein PorP/SprF [Flavobacteriia bacterium]